MPLAPAYGPLWFAQMVICVPLAKASRLMPAEKGFPPPPVVMKSANQVAVAVALDWIRKLSPPL
jgi:hypothetical protein